MDHWVHLGSGAVLYVPLRVIANGEGAEVTLTLFRPPDRSDAKFAADSEWVEGDLVALKELVIGLRPAGAGDESAPAGLA
jgi:hypothetical protein